MSLIVGDKLKVLVDRGYITGIAPNAVKGGTIDVRLFNIIEVEKPPVIKKKYRALVPGKTRMHTKRHNLNIKPYDTTPGQFVLGGLMECFNLPTTIKAKFYFASTVARCGLEHSAAIDIKSGWAGRLTLELINLSQYHGVKLRAGMDIGCIEFYEHEPVEPYAGKFVDQLEVRG